MTEIWTAEQAREYFRTGREPRVSKKEITRKTNLRPHRTVNGPREKRMNGTEARFVCDYLEPRKRDGLIRSYGFEACKIRLADCGCWYTPDFVATDREGATWIIEVKGAYEREDARIKRLVAARLVRAWGWKFLFAQWKKQQWEYTEL
ncbi:hypothetical protein [Desulfovibrio inopinatus]|uniref:hypothetical protein n=1 Tax=Desulfovibrio inopinatus TaxID=102109 RepID=UPI0004171A37|nr:hypothetical protein [Desulfovibrio inopinatus]